MGNRANSSIFGTRFLGADSRIRLDFLCAAPLESGVCAESGVCDWSYRTLPAKREGDAAGGHFWPEPLREYSGGVIYRDATIGMASSGPGTDFGNWMGAARRGAAARARGPH